MLKSRPPLRRQSVVDAQSAEAAVEMENDDPSNPTGSTSCGGKFAFSLLKKFNTVAICDQDTVGRGAIEACSCPVLAVGGRRL